MDIAITLPRKLWDDICSGKKEYECRKQIPRFFMRNYDKCWVIIKGTKEVVGWFTIEKFLSCVDIEDIINNYLAKLCIEKAWFDEYAKHEDVLCLWKIGRVHKVNNPKGYYEWIGITHNPQSYVYWRKYIVI